MRDAVIITVNGVQTGDLAGSGASRGVIGSALALALALPASAAPDRSLCLASERPVFACPIGRKLVSVCAGPAGQVVYRFGERGRVELRSRDLSLATQGFSGGGETQITAKGAGGYAYTVYARTLRTSFGRGGRNDPKSDSGLLVRRGGRAVASLRCGGAGYQPIDEAAVRNLPTGPFIPH